MTLVSTFAALAMAIGAPLVYADQAWSIQKKRNSEGFSKDVCAVLLIANVCRLFFWLGERFEFALLLQSILMIVAQLFLLSLLLKFRPGSFASSAYSIASDDRGEAANRATTNVGPSANTTPSTAQRHAEFSADEAFDGPAGADQHKANTAQSTTGSAGQLGAAPPSSNGAGYAPLLFGLHLPPPPTLGLEEGEEDEEDADVSSSSARGRIQRAGRKTVRFLLAGVKRERGGTRRDGSSGSRPFGFWTWPDYSSYVLFLLVLTAFLGVLQLLLGSLQSYVWMLGMFALGLESTLPIPQAIKNQQRKSLSGFRTSVLLGWLVGDVYKSVYFLANGSPVQFIISGLFALSVDCVICAQLYFFRDQTARDDEDVHAQQAESLEAGQRRRAPIEDGGPRSNSGAGAGRGNERAKGVPLSTRTSHREIEESSHFQIEADDDEDDDDVDDGDMGRSRG